MKDYLEQDLFSGLERNELEPQGASKENENELTAQGASKENETELAPQGASTGKEDQLAPPGASKEKKAELAPPVASNEDDGRLATLKTDFSKLEMRATDKAEKLLKAGRSYDSAWAQLIPVLDQIQKFLSQRGEEYRRRTPNPWPSWTKWWKCFQKENDLEASLRSVQKRLKKFRVGLNSDADNPPDEAEQNELSGAFTKLRLAITDGKKAGKSISDVLIDFILHHFSVQEVQEIAARLKMDEKVDTDRPKKVESAPIFLGLVRSSDQQK